jgi:arylformamidase
MTVRLYRNFSTQDEIDKEYNPSTSVSNADHYIQWYVDESAAVRRELACELDLQFGPTLDETVDIFPARVASAPLLVFIHGGYWRRFSSKEFSLVARGLVAHGIAVAVTNYSLCPRRR